VAYFRDAEDVYRFIGELMKELAADEQLGPLFRRANTIVQYETHDPEALITVKLVDGEESRVDCGETALEPEVTMWMHADIAPRFWLGQVSPTIALARGQMKAKGPVAKILKLVPVVKPAFPRYVQMIEEAGRDDLLEPVRKEAEAGA
jgi:putative sterol carrier protein